MRFFLRALVAMAVAGHVEWGRQATPSLLAALDKLPHSAHPITAPCRRPNPNPPHTHPHPTPIPTHPHPRPNPTPPVPPQVKADQIRHMDPSQRASMSAVRTALGSDYEARLRAEAGGWMLFSRVRVQEGTVRCTDYEARLRAEAGGWMFLRAQGKHQHALQAGVEQAPDRRTALPRPHPTPHPLPAGPSVPSKLARHKHQNRCALLSHPNSNSQPPLPAGPSVPSKLARRKHQIGALYSHAKAKELEDFERKVQGSKSKAETHAKYGW